MLHVLVHVCIISLSNQWIVHSVVGLKSSFRIHYITGYENNLYNCFMLLLYLSLWLCSHYFVNGGWFPDNNHLLDNVDKIRHLPATIIQGRYDVVTPMKTAWELHKVLIKSGFVKLWGARARMKSDGVLRQCQNSRREASFFGPPQLKKMNFTCMLNSLLQIIIMRP